MLRVMFKYNSKNLISTIIPLLFMVYIPLSFQQTWVPYSAFNGYVPSYIYPVRLNAGDSLRGYMTWPNSQDLDIYLYRQGQNLLSSETYLKR